MKNVILFGGAFDPVHIGHIEIIKGLSKMFPEYDIWVVPSAVKKSSEINAPSELRVSWIVKALEKYNLKNVEVKTFEIENNIQNTSESLKYLIKNFPDHSFSIAVGSDHNIVTWENHEYLLKNFENIIIIERPRISARKEIVIELNVPQVSSTKFRETLDPLIIPKDISDTVTKFYKERQNEDIL